MRTTGRVLLTAIGAFLTWAAVPEAQAPSLVSALKSGGYVLVMRHAQAPRDVPTKEQANPDNVPPERQLDDEGRRGAAGFGEAVRRLEIPIGDVLTSPTYRARETVRYAGLPSPIVVDDLGDGGQSMQGATEAQASWLRAKAREMPKTGNTLAVTHAQNIARAFPEWAPDMAEGEILVLRPDGKGGVAMVRRVLIEDWQKAR
jgi:phosphohistidine phosphatase SixA